VKNVQQVLKQKEKDLARVRREIESLRLIAPLLSDAGDEKPSEGPRNAPLEATGTDVFSAGVPRISQDEENDSGESS